MKISYAPTRLPALLLVAASVLACRTAPHGVQNPREQEELHTAPNSTQSHPLTAGILVVDQYDKPVTGFPITAFHDISGGGQWHEGRNIEPEYRRVELITDADGMTIYSDAAHPGITTRFSAQDHWAAAGEYLSLSHPESFSRLRLEEMSRIYGLYTRKTTAVMPTKVYVNRNAGPERQLRVAPEGLALADGAVLGFDPLRSSKPLPDCIDCPLRFRIKKCPRPGDNSERGYVLTVEAAGAAGVRPPLSRFDTHAPYFAPSDGYTPSLLLHSKGCAALGIPDSERSWSTFYFTLGDGYYGRGSYRLWTRGGIEELIHGGIELIVNPRGGRNLNAEDRYLAPPITLPFRDPDYLRPELVEVGEIKERRLIYITGGPGATANVRHVFLHDRKRNENCSSNSFATDASGLEMPYGSFRIWCRLRLEDDLYLTLMETGGCRPDGGCRTYPLSLFKRSERVPDSITAILPK